MLGLLCLVILIGACNGYWRAWWDFMFLAVSHLPIILPVLWGALWCSERKRGLGHRTAGINGELQSDYRHFQWRCYTVDTWYILKVIFISFHLKLVYCIDNPHLSAGSRNDWKCICMILGVASRVCCEHEIGMAGWTGVAEAAQKLYT